MVRPVFIPWVTAVTTLPLAIFLTLWGTMFCGGFGLASGLPPGALVFIGVLFLVGVPVVAFQWRQNTYARTEYRFYRDRLEYTEGFWAVEEKTLPYDRITEISLRRGVIQKQYGLGTIYLATPATGYHKGRMINGLRIVDVQNPEGIYRAVKELIHK